MFIAGDALLPSQLQRCTLQHETKEEEEDGRRRVRSIGRSDAEHWCLRMALATVLRSPLICCVSVAHPLCLCASRNALPLLDVCAASELHPDEPNALVQVSPLNLNDAWMDGWTYGRADGNRRVELPTFIGTRAGSRVAKFIPVAFIQIKPRRNHVISSTLSFISKSSFIGTE